MQSVLLFQFPAHTVAAAVEQIPVEPFPVLVHVDRHDVQVVAVDVLVLEYKIRLVSETAFFQILAGDILQLNIGPVSYTHLDVYKRQVPIPK